ncbi:MAG: phage Gp37/Gp68 family protein, partial [Nitrososphaerota archaeon]|nr:phage Gp37/Gp68 family protein [Nitrososphaerota archaeon]
PDNVTVGVSVETQSTADFRLRLLAELPIAHKNIICQPLLEKIDVEKYLDGVELVVVGGESGKNARFLNFDWVLDIREQCRRNNVSFEFR